ncbi:MAG: hypothetical protein K6F71_02580 [Ruminococcus sp.]|uniref:hypothetical protein n=1 Tax=Ruminococcus sp. TaxID=41978 RepID=UPI0025DBB3E0|nr:hypothetical protein [Ruminococcus sp.]MCR5539712.1 hypothetical protein [Ruminococcus sp.]
MKRLLISIVLLSFILTAGISSAAYVRKTDTRIQTLCTRIREQALTNTDTSAAIDELCNCWQEHCKKLSFIENLNGVSAISAEISRLPALSSADPADLIEQIDFISQQCRSLSERHIPNLKTLL